MGLLLLLLHLLFLNIYIFSNKQAIFKIEKCSFVRLPLHILCRAVSFIDYPILFAAVKIILLELSIRSV